MVQFCLSVFSLFVIHVVIKIHMHVQATSSGSLPLYCFNLQLLFFIVVNKITTVL